MNKFDNFLKKELNPNQLQAVKQKNGATLVVAGAGSGKTRVITARMANLILGQNATPASILALTFTNKAAKEMKKRLNKFLGENYILPFVGTFHSYCLLLLRKYSHFLPFESFSIIDADDQKNLIKKILHKHNLEKQFSPKQLQYHISYAKNKIDQEQVFAQPIIKEIWTEYEKIKTTARCLDFDDLILQILRLLQTNEEFKINFQQKIRHILVDEYQDTNSVQHELLKKMCLDKNQKFAIDSLCAVGDEDQSIYSWRGAVVQNMIKFQKDFAPVEKIKIEQNYRSVQPILKAANSVIKHNRTRYNKNLWSEKKAKNRIFTINCKSDYQEADNISTFLSILMDQKKLNEIAIIYRTHFQSRIIEESLIRNSIPYKIIGGLRFYERKEIKDILAYLRLITNPFDHTSLSRIINCPARGLGLKFEELLFEQWTQKQNLEQNFKQILQQIIPQIQPTKALAVKNFLSIFEIIKKEESITEIIEKIIEKTGYLNFLKKSYNTREADTKIENINELLRSVEFFEQNNKIAGSITNLLESFLYEIALIQEKVDDKQETENQVQLMTFHAAKGLEFEIVIIPGLEENTLPNSKSLNSFDELEEERRLFYVGITRARERLILMHSDHRSSFGNITDKIASRFLDEIPSKFFQYVSTTKLHTTQIKDLFNKWLGQTIKSPVLTFGTSSKITKSWSTKTQNAVKKKNSKYAWSKNQMISHKRFGPGLIRKVEKRKDEYYLTIAFKTGEKKILSSFVSRI